MADARMEESWRAPVQCWHMVLAQLIKDEGTKEMEEAEEKDCLEAVIIKWSLRDALEFSGQRKQLGQKPRV